MALALGIVSIWNRFWYGDAVPSPPKRAATSIFAILFVTCWFGMRSEFMLSEEWLRWGTVVAVLAGLSCAPWVSRLVADAFGANLSDRSVSIPFRISAVIASCSVCWMLIVFIFPAWATKWSGAETYTVAKLEKKRTYSRRECDFQIYGEYIQRQPVGYVCVSQREFELLPERGQMEARESRSIFGVHIRGVAPASANKPLQPIGREDAPSG